MIRRISKTIFGFIFLLRCRRDFVVTIMTLCAAVPFFVYCLYFRPILISSPYYRAIDLLNDTFRSVNDSSLEMGDFDFVLCPEKSPYLVGRFPENLSLLHEDSDDPLLSNVVIESGGQWKPIKCQSRNQVAIIIPFRDRMEHLDILLNRLHLVLQRQMVDYRIFVAEQAGTSTFNKARLMNIAFKYVYENYPIFTCIVFHDVDMIPEDDRNLYACGDRPRHLSPAVNEMNYTLPYHELIGGVLAIRPHHFKIVNGYSNLYWGWGGEDDDMYYRMEAEKLKVERPPQGVGRYSMLTHAKREAIPSKIRYKLVWSAKKRYKRDGYAQLDGLNYKIIAVTEEETFTRLQIDVGKKVSMAGFY